MQISDDEYYDIKQNLINALAPQLGIEPERELRATEIQDKDGVIYDLETLVRKQCVVDTGINIYMPVWNSRAGRHYWMDSYTAEYSSKDLAGDIKYKATKKNPDLEVNIHDFGLIKTIEDQEDTDWLSNEQFYWFAQKLLRDIAPQLGIKLEEQPSVYDLKDKNGVIHKTYNLEEKQCIINTGMRIYMVVRDVRDDNRKYWVATDSSRYESSDLTRFITVEEFADNPHLEVTVHEFRDIPKPAYRPF